MITDTKGAVKQKISMAAQPEGAVHRMRRIPNAGGENMNGPDCNASCPLRRTYCSFYAKCALFFLALLIALSLGLILGAVFAAIVLPALAAVIAFAAALSAVFIALLIYWRRRSI